MGTSAMKIKPRGSPQPPPTVDPVAMLQDIHARVLRIETRQVRHMMAQGFDTEGNPLPVQGRRR